MPSLRLLLLLPLVLAAVLLPASAESAAKDNSLVGTVGPGFTIRLTDSSNHAVVRLNPGAYTITVKNLSTAQVEHDFHLTGPGGVDLTSGPPGSTDTWNVNFVNGTYKFHCDFHPTQMKGSFTVGAPLPPPAPKLTGRVGPAKVISLKRGASPVKTLKAGKFRVAVSDLSKTDNFHLSGPGVNKKTGLKFRGAATWAVTLRAGSYTFRSDATKRLRRSFKVTP